MIHEIINLKNEFNTLENDAILTSYCPDNFNEWSLKEKRKCLLVLPGGGYEFVSEREKEPVALRFLGYDIACFTLQYTITPKLKYPYPLVEVYAAWAYIRRNAEKYHIDIDKIAVIGFSAGGHLAASCSCYHQDEEYAKYLNINVEEMKINGCLLAYPVISSDFGHSISIRNITQGRKDLYDKFSIEKNVTPSFPKTFIWHTTFDTIVPLRNSLALAEALSMNKVFLELHVYPMHDHGQALCDRSVYTKEMLNDEIIREMKHNTQWVDNAVHFIKEYL